MTANEQAALDAGRAAAARGEAAWANPHPLSTSASRAWAKGWRRHFEQGYGR